MSKGDPGDLFGEVRELGLGDDDEAYEAALGRCVPRADLVPEEDWERLGGCGWPFACLAFFWVVVIICYCAL